MASRPRGCSDDRLQALWRLAVRARWGNQCALSQWGNCSGECECHHLKRRGIPHLRNVTANGVLLCAAHHRLAGQRFWRTKIEALVGKDTLEWLDEQERKTFQDLLSERGMTRGEYLLERKAALLAEVGRPADAGER